MHEIDYYLLDKDYIKYSEQSNCSFLTNNSRISSKDYFYFCITFAPPNKKVMVKNTENMIAIYLEEICNMEPQYQWAMMKVFLRGFCTEKGTKELNRIITILEKFK